MSCNKCGQPKQTCGCQKQVTFCGCPTKVDAKCVIYSGCPLTPLGVIKGDNLEDILQQINELFNDVYVKIDDAFIGTNVGLGAEMYKGQNAQGVEEFRTITRGEGIFIEQKDKEIRISTDLEWLEEYLKDFINTDYFLEKIKELIKMPWFRDYLQDLFLQQWFGDIIKYWIKQQWFTDYLYELFKQRWFIDLLRHLLSMQWFTDFLMSLFNTPTFQGFFADYINNLFTSGMIDICKLIQKCGGNPAPTCPAEGTFLSQRCEGTTKVVVTADGKCGQVETRTANSPECGYVECPAAGTVISSSCEGTTKVIVKADGNCGTTTERIADSPDCGFVACPAAGTLISDTCDGTTRVVTKADGNCGFTVERTPNSPKCGYVECPAAGTFISQRCEGTTLVVVTADGSCGQTETRTENAAECITCAPRGEFISQHCDGTTLVKVFHDGACGTYEERTANSVDCGYVACPSAGSLASERCEGTTKVRVYHDGNCGTYEQREENSAECGYTADHPPVTQDNTIMLANRQDTTVTKANLIYSDPDGDEITNVRFNGDVSKLFTDAGRTQPYAPGTELPIDFTLYFKAPDQDPESQYAVQYNVKARGVWSA